MGDYINPKGMSKEDWLHQHGEILTVDQVLTKVWSDPIPYEDQTHWVVCLVDNGFFTAAAIGTSRDEVRSFLQPDGRGASLGHARRDCRVLRASSGCPVAAFRRVSHIGRAAIHAKPRTQ